MTGLLAWLKKWWMLVVGAIALVGGFLLGLLARKSPVVIGPDHEKERAEADKNKQVDAAVVARDKAQEEAKDAYVKSEKKLLSAQEELVKELESDPDATNEFLKKTGQDVRGP